MMSDFMCPKIVDTGKESVRGIAAFLVMLAHAYSIFIWPHIGDSFVSRSLGQAAHQSVMIFFIISGFLISLSIKTNIKKNSGNFDLSKYLVSRCARIYPPLLFALATAVAFFIIIEQFELPGYALSSPYNIGQITPSRETFQISISDIKNALLMNNGMLTANGPLWSLCIEWRIYLVAGLMAAFLFSNNTYFKVFCAVGAFYLFIKLLTVNEHSLFYLSVWLIGGGFGIFQSKIDPLLSKLRKKLLCSLIGLLIILAAIQPSLLISGGAVFGVKENLFQFIVCIFWSIFLLQPKAKELTPTKIVSMWFGKISYSIYILHFPVLLFFLSLFQNVVKDNITKSLWACIAAIVFAVVLSIFSARIFERKTFFEKVIMYFTKPICAVLRRYRPEK